MCSRPSTIVFASNGVIVWEKPQIRRLQSSAHRARAAQVVDQNCTKVPGLKAFYADGAQGGKCGKAAAEQFKDRDRWGCLLECQAYVLPGN